MAAKKKTLTRGERVCEFITRYCKTPEGAKVGQPLELAEFQRRFLLAVYDNPHGTRRAYLSIGRKNGKSGLTAAILLAHLVGPEAKQNSQIVSGARSRDQAALVFDLARKMLAMSPELQGLVRVVPSGKRLIGLPMNVEYRALAAEGTTAHGLSPVLAILDEVGQIKGPKDDFVDAITTAQGAHESPMLLAISTQAPTDGDLFSIWLDDAASSKNPAIVSHVYQAPDDCELMDKDAWRAANPAMGVFRSERDIEEQAERAMRLPSEEATFRVLTLNQRVNPFSPFLSRSVWEANSTAPDDEAFRFGEVYGGLDLSQTTDLTAFVLIARYNGRFHVRPWFFMAEGLVPERARADRVPYDIWHKQGLIEATPGKVVALDWVAAKIAEVTTGLPVKAIAFDRWRMPGLMLEIDRLGLALPLQEYGQGYASMSPAVAALEEAALQELIQHGGHPVLNMCAGNAVAIRDPAGNRKLDKARSTGRIDGIVALAMAMGVAAMNKEEPAASTPMLRVL
jgi:phage terminase large subunit-like protein